MTEAEQAHAAAERLIEAARASGASEISFDGDETRALQTVPPGIADLSALRHLNFKNTQVTALAPLAGLTALTRLLLVNTTLRSVISRPCGRSASWPLPADVPAHPRSAGQRSAGP